MVMLVMLSNISSYFHVLISLGSPLTSRLNKLLSPETDGVLSPLFQEINNLFSTKGLGVVILGFCGSHMVSGTDSFFVCSSSFIHLFYNLWNI